MTNEQISLILNQYQYENRNDWFFHIRNDSFISLQNQDDSDANGIELPESAAIAICEKLIKQSSDDDIKAIVLSITKPLQDRIAELETDIEPLQEELLEANDRIIELEKELSELQEANKSFDREFYNR